MKWHPDDENVLCVLIFDNICLLLTAKHNHNLRTPIWLHKNVGIKKLSNLDLALTSLVSTFLIQFSCGYYKWSFCGWMMAIEVPIYLIVTPMVIQGIPIIIEGPFVAGWGTWSSLLSAPRTVGIQGFPVITEGRFVTGWWDMKFPFICFQAHGSSGLSSNYILLKYSGDDNLCLGEDNYWKANQWENPEYHQLYHTDWPPWAFQ